MFNNERMGKSEQTRQAITDIALRSFADSLRADEPSLRVTSVHPGRIDTEMQRDLIAYEERDYVPEQFLSPQTVAAVIAQAVNAPADAHVHEIVVRPR